MTDSKPIRVRIESHGLTPHDLRVTDIETGRPVEGILSVSFKADTRTPIANTVVLEVLAHEIAVEALVAEVREEPPPKPEKA
jgi:hypothetical protein